MIRLSLFFTFSLFCLFGAHFLKAQDNIKNILDLGHKSYLKGDFDQALKYYSQVLEKHPDQCDALLFTGIIWYSRKDYQQALDFLNKCPQKEQATFLFYSAECYFFKEQYELALLNYEKFIKHSHPDFDLVQRASNQIKHARFASQAIKAPIPSHTEPEWLKKLTSDSDDHNPWTIQGDQFLFFVSDRYLDRDYDIFRCEWNGNSYTSPERLPSPINSNHDEGEFALSDDGKFLVFTYSTWCPPSTNCKGDYKIKTSYNINGKWSPPKLLSETIYYYRSIDHSTGQSNWIFDETLANPAISADGKIFLFASKRPGGMGGFDLWMSTQSDTGWTQPRNLGPTINTPENEADPYLLPDNMTLFFSSAGHPGFGGYDFFMSSFESGSWSTPINLGKPFNTSADEFDLFVSQNGKRFWFNREKKSTRMPNRTIRQLQVIELSEPLPSVPKK